MRGSTTAPHQRTLILVTAFAPLSLNMIVPSLPSIAAAYGVEYAVAAIALGGYLAVTAVMQLALGPLSDRVGRRPVMLVALAVFTLASVGCAVAPTIGTFLVCRMLQTAMSAGMVLTLAVVRDTTPPGEVTARISTIAGTMALAPMVAPLLGGAIDAALGWRAVFGAYALGGAALLVLVWANWGETRAAPTPGLAPERVRRLLSEPLFWGYALSAAFSTGGFYVFISGAPLIAAEAYGLSPAALGPYVGSITAGFITGTVVARRLGRRYPLRTTMLLGRIAACGGPLVGLLLLASGPVGVLTLFLCTVWVGFGNGLTGPSANAGATGVRPSLAGSAAGIVGAVTVGTGALLTSATGVVLTQMPSAAVFLAMLFGISAAGLLAALFVWRREPR